MGVGAQPSWEALLWLLTQLTGESTTLSRPSRSAYSAYHAFREPVQGSVQTSQYGVLQENLLHYPDPPGVPTVPTMPSENQCRALYRPVSMGCSRMNVQPEDPMSPEHQEIVSYVSSGWLVVKSELEQGGVKYYSELSN